MSTCWRCGEAEGIILHIAWSCWKLGRFWKQVRDTIKRLTNFDLGTDLARYLLHYSDLYRHRYKNSMLVHPLNAAKACIPAVWKQNSPLTFSLCLIKIADIYGMESITAALRSKEEIFNKKWIYWTQYTCSRDYGSALVEDGWWTNPFFFPFFSSSTPPSFFPFCFCILFSV